MQLSNKLCVKFSAELYFVRELIVHKSLCHLFELLVHRFLA